jgi:hypothetical protein
MRLSLFTREKSEVDFCCQEWQLMISASIAQVTTAQERAIPDAEEAETWDEL